jgi:hypothetical protein
MAYKAAHGAKVNASRTTAAGANMTSRGMTRANGTKYQKVIPQMIGARCAVQILSFEITPQRLNADLKLWPFCLVNLTDNSLIAHCNIGIWMGLYKGRDAT